MQNLKEIIQNEQPAINAAIQGCIATLPPSSRPVASYIFEAGGKRLRPLLTLWSGRLFGCTDKALYTLGASIELLHAATLLHDDILDNADLRRGRPAAHTFFNTTHVILAGDAILAKSLMIVASYGDTRLTGSLSEAVLRTAEGQITELENLHNVQLPYKQYLQIITGKTAWLLKTSCELGAIYAGASTQHIEALATFGLELGIAFQLVDDALDFSPAEETGKPSGGDLIEGKMTPPLLLYMQALSATERATFTELFSQSAMPQEQADNIATAIRDGGFCTQTRAMAEKHVNNALDALKELPQTREKELLEAVARYTLTRSQ